MLKNRPNSPDFSLLDYFAWREMGKTAQALAPKSFEDLKEAVVVAWQALNPEALERASMSWEERVEQCIEQKGDRFEHML